MLLSVGLSRSIHSSGFLLLCDDSWTAGSSIGCDIAVVVHRVRVRQAFPNTTETAWVACLTIETSLHVSRDLRCEVPSRKPKTSESASGVKVPVHGRMKSLRKPTA